MTLHVGQKVVRIDYKGPPSGHGGPPPGTKFYYPDIGEVVTIRAINEWPLVTLLTLNEYHNEHLIGQGDCMIEPGFAAYNFRPVKTTSLEVFHKMLAPTGKRKAIQSA